MTTHTIPYCPTDLAKLQEKYSKKPTETETEYVWQVTLTGSDCILLGENKARG